MSFAKHAASKRLFLAILFSLLSVVVWASVAAENFLNAPIKGAGFFDDLATQATRNASSRNVVLGETLEDGVRYTKVADHYKASCFKLDNWRQLTKQLTPDELWKINEAFLDQQIRAGKQIILSHDPARATGFFQREVKYLEGLGYEFVQDGWVWKAVLK